MDSVKSENGLGPWSSELLNGVSKCREAVAADSEAFAAKSLLGGFDLIVSLLGGITCLNYGLIRFILKLGGAGQMCSQEFDSIND